MLGSIDYSRDFWIGLAFVLAVVLLFVLYGFIGTFVLGLILYYASRPIYVRLRRRIRPPFQSRSQSCLVCSPESEDSFQSLE